MDEDNKDKVQHYEKIKNDIRNEIKQRIKQRDNFSVQMIISIGVIISVSFGIEDCKYDKLLILLPLISIFYTGMILYSYKIHHVLAKYLKEVIEEKLSELLMIDKKNEWENYYVNQNKTPGIRHIFYKIAMVLITITSSAYLIYTHTIKTTNKVEFLLIIWILSIFYLINSIVFCIIFKKK